VIHRFAIHRRSNLVAILSSNHGPVIVSEGARYRSFSISLRVNRSLLRQRSEFAVHVPTAYFSKTSCDFTLSLLVASAFYLKSATLWQLHPREKAVCTPLQRQCVAHNA
jgi:hypothetical protein